MHERAVRGERPNAEAADDSRSPCGRIHRKLAWIGLGSLGMLLACSGASSSSSGGGPVTLRGAVSKGPFVLGSPLTVSLLDDQANPTGESFPTETSDDLGDFAVQLPHPGPVLLQGSGYYFNEISGTLSGSTLTLNAYSTLSQSGSQTVYVNLLTQLTHDRILALLAPSDGGTSDAGASDAGLSDGGSSGDGISLASAIAQAESELEAQLPIGGNGSDGGVFDAGGGMTQMNLLSGDNDGNAYLFAASALFVQAAQDSAGPSPVDAVLQKLINKVASGFAASGALDSDTIALLRTAEQEIEPEKVRATLAGYLVDGGVTGAEAAVAPDINRALDSDLDGIPNAKDNCPLVANPEQNTVNGVCEYKRSHFDLTEQVTSEKGKSSSEIGYYVTGDFNGDGAPDLVIVGADGAQILLNDGAGSLGASSSVSFTGLPRLVDSNSEVVPSILNAKAADLDGDGQLDLVLLAEVGRGQLPPPIVWDLGKRLSAVFWLKGDGKGGFASPELSIPPTDLSDCGYCDPLPPGPIGCNTGCQPYRCDSLAFIGFADFVVVDLDGDGHPDVAGTPNWGFVEDSIFYGPGPDNLVNGAGPGFFSPYYSNGDRIVVAMALADGGFAPPVLSEFDRAGDVQGYYGQPPAVAAGDLNGDGKMDLVVASNDYPSVWRAQFLTDYGYPPAGKQTGGLFALLGNGDGTFQAERVNVAAGSELTSVALADVDGDGHLDAVVATQAHCPEGYPCHPGYFFGQDGGAALETVTVLFGDGAGGFAGPASASFTAPSEGFVGFSQQTVPPAVADYTGDGHPDISILNYVAVSQGRTLAAPVALALPPNAWRFTPNAWSHGDAPLFAPYSPYCLNCPVAWCVNCWTTATADFNGDGRADLVGSAGGPSPQALILYVNPPGWQSW